VLGVSNANDIKTCCLSEHVSSCFVILLEVILKVACCTIKDLVLNLTSGEICPHMHVFPYPPIQHNICQFESRSFIMWIGQKVHRRLFFHRYPRAPKNIKMDIPNKLVSVFEARKLSTMYCMLPKVIQTRLTTNKGKYHEHELKGTVRQYLGII
jgi:hypothetical protein